MLGFLLDSGAGRILSHPASSDRNRAAAVRSALGEIALPAPHDDCLPLREVAHLHHALLDLDERPVAAVPREPDGAADRCRRESASRPKSTLRLPPELANGLRRRCSRGGGACRALRAAAERPAREPKLDNRLLVV